jgi:mono/diheme cytochrome c family protein
MLRRIWIGCAAAAITAMVWGSSGVQAQDPVARGKYLAAVGGCTDCHTPGYFLGKPDEKRYLGGSEVGFEIPGMGVFHGPNLTPDKETGLGNWSSEEIVTALIMPWKALAQLTKDDAMAIVAYLKSVPPVRNKVLGPFGPTEKPTGFVMRIVPPGAPAPK